MRSCAADLRRLIDRPEQREAAIADRVARRRPVVHEAGELEAELAVIEDPVRDHPAEIAGADDQHVLEADAGAPPAAQQVAHDLARHVREEHVQREEERQHRARDRMVVVADRRVVDLHVQRDDDAGQHRQDRADEHREEVVHARAPAPEPVEALDMERERDEQRDDRQRDEILRERRLRLGDRDKPTNGVAESDVVGERERQRGADRIGEDVADDEKAVVAPQHPRPEASVSSRIAWKACSKRSTPNVSAWRRSTAASTGRVRTRAIASAKASAVLSGTSTPVTPS